jgi:cyclopropane fatty-acyl-phospholipid synthase-like methyltransferase
MLSKRDYYDAHSHKLLEDYLFGNRRATAASKFVCRRVTRGSRILEIGCGIGTLAHQLSESLGTEVLAVDLSQEAIRIALKLFSSDRVAFEQRDITTSLSDMETRFDFIVLVDVFEHIEKPSRSHFCSSLSRLLDQNGKLLLTCPTVSHQEYLRTCQPSGLQPVDENIDLAVLQEVCAALNAQLTYYSVQSIWRHSDYFHAELSRVTRASDSKSDVNRHCADNSQSVVESFQQRYDRLNKVGLLRNLPPDLQQKACSMARREKRSRWRRRLAPRTRLRHLLKAFSFAPLLDRS